MKHILYSEDEKIVVQENELSSIIVLKEYYQGIIKVNYKGKIMYYIDNPNWNEQTQLQFEPHFRLLIIFITQTKTNIDEILRIADKSIITRISVIINVIFDTIFCTNFSIKERFIIIFISLPSFLKFFATIRKLKTLLEK